MSIALEPASLYSPLTYSDVTGETAARRVDLERSMPADVKVAREADHGVLTMPDGTVAKIAFADAHFDPRDLELKRSRRGVWAVRRAR